MKYMEMLFIAIATAVFNIFIFPISLFMFMCNYSRRRVIYFYDFFGKCFSLWMILFEIIKYLFSYDPIHHIDSYCGTFISEHTLIFVVFIFFIDLYSVVVVGELDINDECK
ncbi:MAG: hypothetical protein ACRCX2_16885 [Paraclostridium sp.]